MFLDRNIFALAVVVNAYEANWPLPAFRAPFSVLKAPPQKKKAPTWATSIYGSRAT